MGPRLSLIAVRMLSKVKKSNRKKPSGIMIPNNVRCYGSIIEGTDAYNHQIVRKDTIDSSVLSENQSGICSTVVFGTSNHNFYNIRRSRLVSRLWSFRGNNIMQILSYIHANSSHRAYYMFFLSSVCNQIKTMQVLNIWILLGILRQRDIVQENLQMNYSTNESWKMHIIE